MDYHLTLQVDMDMVCWSEIGHLIDKWIDSCSIETLLMDTTPLEKDLATDHWIEITLLWVLSHWRELKMSMCQI